MYYELSNISDDMNILYKMCISNKTGNPDYCLKYASKQMYDIGLNSDDDLFKIKEAIKFCTFFKNDQAAIHCSDIDYHIHSLFPNIRYPRFNVDGSTMFRDLVYIDRMRETSRCTLNIDKLSEIALAAFMQHLTDPMPSRYTFPGFENIEEVLKFKNNLIYEFEYKLTKEEYPMYFPTNTNALEKIFPEIKKRIRQLQSSSKGINLPVRPNMRPYPTKKISSKDAAQLKSENLSDVFWANVFLSDMVEVGSPIDGIIYIDKLEHSGVLLFRAAEIIGNLYGFAPFDKRAKKKINSTDPYWDIVEAFKYATQDFSYFACEGASDVFSSFINSVLFLEDFVDAYNKIIDGKYLAAGTLYHRLALMGFDNAKASANLAFQLANFSNGNEHTAKNENESIIDDSTLDEYPYSCFFYATNAKTMREANEILNKYAHKEIINFIISIPMSATCSFIRILGLGGGSPFGDNFVLTLIYNRCFIVIIVCFVIYSYGNSK